MAPTSESQADPFVEFFRQLTKESGPWLALSLGLHLAVLAVLGFIVLRRERQTEVLTTISGFDYRESGPNQKRRKPIVPVQVDAVKIDPVEAVPGQRARKTPEKVGGEPIAAVKKPGDV